MKTKIIMLQQCSTDDDLYLVDKLVNTVEPRVGSFLTEKQVRVYTQVRDTKVTIKRAKT